MKHAVGGGYLLLSNGTDASGEKSIIMTRFSEQFMILWQKEIGEQGIDETANSFFQDSLGNIYLSGNSNVSGILLIKIDSTGNKIWNVAYDHALGLYLSGLGFDGLYILGRKFPNDSVVVTKCDTSGSLLWASVVGDFSNRQIKPLNMVYKLNKFGACFWRYGLNTNDIGMKYYDNNGNTLGGSFLLAGIPNFIIPSVTDIVVTRSGGMCLLGNHTNSDYYPCIGTLDANGNSVYTKTYDHQGEFLRCVETSDGGFAILAKLTSSFSNSIQLLKIDSSLSIQWVKEFHDLNLIEATSLLISSDDGFCITGNDSMSNIIIIKTDSAGNSFCSENFINIDTLTGGFGTLSVGWQINPLAGLPGNCNLQVVSLTISAMDTLCFYTGFSKNNDEAILTLSPNPTSDKFTIAGRQFTIKQVEIFNLVGENIYTTKVNREQFTVIPITIGSELFPPGIYFVTASDESGQRVTAKISIIR